MSTLSHPPATLTARVAKLRAIEAELCTILIEREPVIRGALLGLIARQHVLLLGAPGTGKSLLVRAIAQRIVGVDRFELLLTKFTTPEELFGPLCKGAGRPPRHGAPRVRG
jgi:MoxR-like ATPase